MALKLYRYEIDIMLECIFGCLPFIVAGRDTVAPLVVSICHPSGRAYIYPYSICKLDGLFSTTAHTMVIVCGNVEKFMPAIAALPANNNGVPYHRARGTQTIS